MCVCVRESACYRQRKWDGDSKKQDKLRGDRRKIMAKKR